MKLCTQSGKRCYPSEGKARAAHSKARFSIRAYRCEHCHAVHVANRDKR